MAYTDSLKPVKALTSGEVARILRVTGEHRNGYRDHMIIALALVSGLREHELIGLNMGDLYTPRGLARTRVKLLVFKTSNSDESMQQVLLSGAIRAKLDKYRQWKDSAGLGIQPSDPVFESQRNKRLSLRMVRHMWGVWQVKAGFERRLPFHALRHTACQALYRRTKDIKLVQQFARHKSVNSTMIYTTVSDDDLLKALEDQPC